jgi:hypothetical protein
MQRPSHKELYKKIYEARSAVLNSNVLIINQEAIAADAIELGYLIETELLSVLQGLLNETVPANYAGARPPQKSYEIEIEGLEIFAFVVNSARFKCRVYYKFAMANDIYWLISLHADRPNKEDQ